MKITAPIRFLLKPLLAVVGAVLSKILSPVFNLLERIPIFRELRRRGRRSPLYWLTVGATLFLIFIILSSVTVGALMIYFSKDLPSPTKLVDRKVSLSTKIYDRNGKLLYDIYGDENRTLITLDKVPEVMKQATIAIEDKNFYHHRGFDPLGMIRAFYNIITRRELQGGSTLTQQLVKNTLLTKERTIVRKIKEFVLSLQIEARYSKDAILQMYFNETPYGGQAIGVQAAAENYFGKNASDLSLAEAALLSGLAQAPSRYSPYRDPELAKWRQGEVLRRMREDGYITREQEEEAKNTPLTYKPEGSQIRAPHFVMYVKEILAERYGEAFVETGGLNVTTSLDLDLHDKFQSIVTEEIAKDKGFRVSNGALVALNPKTGEILAMVGSKDYFATDIDGQFNVTTSPSRQPGSSIKPLMYATAFKQGFSPATRLIGVPTTFDTGAGQPPYNPQNYANKNYGIFSIRRALGNSLNLPAVKTLSLIGVDNLIATAHEMGITTLNEPGRYGVALTLGGGEVKMLDMAAAFSVFATGGIRHDPVPILKVTDHNGQVLEEFKPNSGIRALSEQVAYLISNIISDSSARSLTFGGGNQLGLNIPGHTVAVKTGTTNDNRDNWAIGYTPAHPDSPVAIAIASWIGNNDNSPMNPNFFAGAARIWNQAMVSYLKDKPNVGFVQPGGIVTGTVDDLSGMAPGPYTEATSTDIFGEGTVPTESDNWHVRLWICKPDGLLASDACRTAGQAEERNFIQIKAEKPEWQDDVDAWVAQAFAGQSQYFPPKETSKLCFDGAGSVIGCTEGAAGPLLSTANVTLHNYTSGNVLTDLNNVPADFEVRAKPTPQPGTGIAFVKFTLSGPDCPTNPDECNTGATSGTVTTSTCGDRCYSSKKNGPGELPLFQLGKIDSVIPGAYTLRIEVQDTAGGSRTLEISITVTGG